MIQGAHVAQHRQPRLDFAMPSFTPHKPYPVHDVPATGVPGSMPVEPDGAPVPPFIPNDPERERVVDPEDRA